MQLASKATTTNLLRETPNFSIGGDAMAKKNYWIGVACKDQVFVGVKGGFAQLGYGKKISLQRMNEGDWIIDYSPRVSLRSDERCHSFTAIGRVASDEVYQAELGEGFLPYRLEVDFERCEEASILPLIERLSFIENKMSWEYSFRLGHLEINEEDFELLAEEMGLDIDAIKH